MTTRATTDRLARIEARIRTGALDRLTEAELTEMINTKLMAVCEGYSSVNQAAEAFRKSPDLLDRQVAERLDGYIGYVVEEREAGRMH